jgi:DNA-binding GntR family transcriptional regulator
MTTSNHPQAAGSTNGNGVREAPSRALLKERAYDELKRLILDGEIEPGSFIAERQLAARLGMSKTPVRSALERLESEGFVRISPQQGAMVCELTFHQIADQYEIRTALETFVARSLAGRLTGEQVRSVQENLEAQRVNLGAGDVARGVALDEEFHGLFCEFLGNREILRVMGRLRDKVHRVILLAFRANAGRMAGSYEEHRGIAEAIIRGDAPLAARRVEEHLQYGKEALLSPRRR